MKMKFRIKYNYIPVLLLLLLTTGSCKKDFLNREPSGSLPAGDAIKTVDDMEIALNGIYAGLRSPNLYGRTIPLFADELADNVYISSDNSNRYLDFFQVNYTVNNGNARGIWQSAYNEIMNANNVILSTVTGTAAADQFRGEALALRALMYFELVKHFSRPYTVVGPTALGVPLVLTNDPFKKPSRNTLGEVYTQIEKDLTDAIPLLTDEERSSGYINEWAAKAILARMHQFKGEWTDALTIAQDVITNSGYTLLDLSTFTNYWRSNTARNDGLETLFEVVNDLVGNAGNDALSYFYDQAGYGDALAANNLYNLYAATDIRKSLILTFSPTRGNVRVVNKYPNSTQPEKDEVKIVRLSEVYLIAAEAAYNLSNEPVARQYLNAVATRRDPTFLGYVSIGAALLNDILLERRKELAFEGHRYWDLARNNLNVTRVNTAGNYTGVPLTIATTNFRRILPIPQTEIDANPNIRNQQNPGY
jgi:hypothetical protein